MQKKFTVLALALLSFIHSPTLMSVIAGISCLSKETDKVIVLHDLHDHCQEYKQTIEHQKELEFFIKTIAGKGPTTDFYMEHPSNAPSFAGTIDNTTIHVPIKRALHNNFKEDCITYKPFDQRNETFFWIREALANPDAFQVAISANHSALNTFRKITLQAYIITLHDQQKVIKNLSSESIFLPIKSLVQERIDKFEKVIDILKPSQQTMFNKPLYQTLLTNNKDQQASMFVSITEAESATSDIRLLQYVIEDKNPLKIIHAGAYHTDFIERCLLALNYCNNFPYLELKYGLSCRTLSSLKKPTLIPSSFIKNLYTFLQLCSICQKNTTKKCSQCKHTYYCSSECQKNDFQEHKNACKEIANKLNPT